MLIFLRHRGTRLDEFMCLLNKPAVIKTQVIGCRVKSISARFSCVSWRKSDCNRWSFIIESNNCEISGYNYLKWFSFDTDRMVDTVRFMSWLPVCLRQAGSDCSKKKKKKKKDISICYSLEEFLKPQFRHDTFKPCVNYLKDFLCIGESEMMFYLPETCLWRVNFYKWVLIGRIASLKY